MRWVPESPPSARGGPPNDRRRDGQQQGLALQAAYDGRNVYCSNVNTMRLIIVRSGFLSYLTVITILTFLRHDLSIRNDEISKLLVGRYSPYAVGAFVVLSLAALWLGSSVVTSARTTRLLILTYSASVLIAGLTKPAQVVHDIASLIAFAVIPVATFLQARRSKRNYYWLIAMFLTVLAWPLVGFGYGERLTVYVEIAWLIWASFTIELRGPVVAG